MLLTATLEKLPADTAIFTLAGAMTLGTSLKIVDSQVQAAIAGGASKVVFDLSSVDCVDSAGLGMLVYTYGALRAKNGAFRLCGVNTRVMSLLKLTKTDTYIAVDPCREDSLAALN
jgi:anti-anti-sigma factor